MSLRDQHGEGCRSTWINAGPCDCGRPTPLQDTIADAITYHPGNRTGTPDQRHPASLALASAIIPAIQATLPATPWTGKCIECEQSIEDGEQITWRFRWAPHGPIHEECR